MSIERKIRRTSIRGRFAIGLTAVEKAFAESIYNNDPSVRLIVGKYAEFTNSRRLDIWEQEIRWYGPSVATGEPSATASEIVHALNAINQRIDNGEGMFSHIVVYDEQVYERLLVFLAALDPDIIELLNLCESIGTGNIYGGTGKYSESTLKPTLEIIRRTGINLDFDSLSRRHPFSSEHGWGEEFVYETLETT